MTYHVCGSPDPRVRELTFPILMRELIIQPDENDIKRLKKISENKGKKWYEIYLPTLTKLVKYYYNLLKQKIIPIFHPGYESLDFNELYSEIDREEKINNIIDERRQSAIDYEKVHYIRDCYVSDDLFTFIKKQDEIHNNYIYKGSKEKIMTTPINSEIKEKMNQDQITKKSVLILD